MYKIVYTRQGLKEKKIAEKAGLGEKVSKLLDVLKEDPFQTYPHYEKLVGNLSGAYSRRINRQHRLVYMVYEEEKVVKVISVWTHYEVCGPTTNQSKKTNLK
jgi:Txe/YoeB family toxin of toxin-antitoxin system